MATVYHFSSNHSVVEDLIMGSVYFFEPSAYLYGLIIVVHVVESLQVLCYVYLLKLCTLPISFSQTRLVTALNSYYPFKKSVPVDSGLKHSLNLTFLILHFYRVLFVSTSLDYENSMK